MPGDDVPSLASFQRPRNHFFEQYERVHAQDVDDNDPYNSGIFREKATGATWFVLIHTMCDEDGILGNFANYFSIVETIPPHHHVARYHHWFMQGANAYVFFEPHSSALLDLPVPKVKKYMYQTLLALQHLHRNGVMHRTLSTKRLVITKDDDMQLHISWKRTKDFTTGAGRSAENLFVICLFHRPPEVLLGDTYYTEAVDMFSAGSLFAQLLRGGRGIGEGHSYLFRGDSEIGQLLKIYEIMGRPTEENGLYEGVENLPNFSPHGPKWETNNLHLHLDMLCDVGINLFNGLLCLDPKKRLTSSAALKHPWFAEEAVAAAAAEQSRIAAATAAAPSARKKDRTGAVKKQQRKLQSGVPANSARRHQRKEKGPAPKGKRKRRRYSLR